jgi:hypothetical protein
LLAWQDEIPARLEAGGWLDQETARAIAVRASVEYLEDFGPLPEPPGGGVVTTKTHVNRKIS